MNKLLKLQKRALRFIYFSQRNQHTIPLFIDAGVLPLKFWYYEPLANLMFEIRHSNAPGNTQDLFQAISDIHSYNTRSLRLRTADAFPVVASLPPKNSVCEPERQNDFRDVKPFVLMLANQIKG